MARGKGTVARLTKASAILALSLALVPSLARADVSGSGREGLRYDLALDLPLTIAGGLLWPTSELLKDRLAPAACRWCEPGGVDAGFRDAARWSNGGPANFASNITGFALAPLAAFGLEALAADHDGRFRGFPVDALIIVEATILAADVNQATKLLVGRERPFVHVLPADQKKKTVQRYDNNLSFFSGHTTEAAALGASAGTVAWMRGYRWAPIVWGVSGALAIVTGYLRIAADKHYLTDVLAGLVVGAAIGVGLPLLFHGPRPESGGSSLSSSAPLSTGAASFALGGAF